MKNRAFTVGDVMTRRVVALAAGAMFKDIVRALETQHISALPVVDRSKKVLGVVSEADLLRKEELRPDTDDRNRGPAARPSARSDKAYAVTAAELMTSPAVTVGPEVALARAARLMARHGIRRLPVVDADGVLRGIVSRSDLLTVFLRSDQDIAEEVRREVVDGRFPDGIESVRVEVHEGVVVLTGRVRDTSLIPLAERLVRSVEGVVDVRCALASPRHRPALEPDLAYEERLAPKTADSARAHEARGATGPVG
jgi:CBS domain-containing protein